MVLAVVAVILGHKGTAWKGRPEVNIRHVDAIRVRDLVNAVASADLERCYIRICSIALIRDERVAALAGCQQVAPTGTGVVQR